MMTRLLFLTSLLFVLVACGAPQQTDTGTETVTDSDHDADGDHKGHHGKKDGFKHDFSEIDKWVERFESPERAAWQMPGDVVRWMKIDEGMEVADIGAGTGYFLPFLQPVVGETGKVWGLDVEESMVAYMRDRVHKSGWGNVEAKLIPYDDPQLAPGSTDRVLIVNTWHHIGDRDEYSKKLAAALKPGGSVWIVDFTLDAPQGPPKDHRLSPEEVIKELEMGGMTGRILQEETLPNQYIVVGEKAAP